MSNNIIKNVINTLKKCQDTLSLLNHRQISEWIKAIKECCHILEEHQQSHPLYDECLQFIYEKIIQPFLVDLDEISQNRDSNKCLSQNELNFNYVIKRLTLISEFIPNIVKVPQNDLYCKKQCDEEWINLNKYIQYVNLDDPEILSKQFDQFYDYIALGAAYSVLGKRYQNQLLSFLVQNIGGAVMLINRQAARDIKLKEVTNPSISFVQGLWSIQNNTVILKNFMRLTTTSIKSHSKIYIPFLFEESQFQSREDLYKIQEFNGFKMTNNLYDKIQASTLFVKDRKNRIKVRLLSSNKIEFIKNVDYSNLVHKISEVSSEHHQISTSRGHLKSKIKKVILHVHGGGWVAMSSFSHQSYTRKWCKYMGDDTIMFSIDYRLAPEYRYPYALEDVWQLYLWIIFFSQYYLNIDPQQIVIAGDSAGGNMALGICFRCIKYGIRIPDGLLLAYPATNLDFSLFNPYLMQGLVDQVAPATILKLALNEYLKDTNAQPNIDPYLSPLIADETFLLKLPKLSIMCGQLDTLTGDTIRFANRLCKLNKQFTMRIYNGISHGFLNFEVPVFAVPAIKPLIEQSCELLKQLF